MVNNPIFVTKNEKGRLSKITEEADAEYALIPIEEYHGYRNALRIINDRSLQEIDRAKADQHGYTLKYADYRMYDRSYPGYKAFCINKLTPISLKIDAETAYFLIIEDLFNFYNYLDISTVTTKSFAEPSIIRPLDLLHGVQQRDDPCYSQDFYIENNDKGRKIKELLDETSDNIIFEIIRISSNYGQGVYDVSYWATGLI